MRVDVGPDPIPADSELTHGPGRLDLIAGLTHGQMDRPCRFAVRSCPRGSVGLRYEGWWSTPASGTEDAMKADANRERPATHPTDTCSVIHEAFGRTGHVQLLLSDDTLGGGGGDHRFYVDPHEVLGQDARSVSRRSTPQADDEWGPVAKPGAFTRRPVVRLTTRRRGYTVSELDLSLPDAPLIVEDLLVKAKWLAASGAPSESIEVILDHVAALRERRG